MAEAQASSSVTPDIIAELLVLGAPFARVLQPTTLNSLGAAAGGVPPHNKDGCVHAGKTGGHFVCAVVYIRLCLVQSLRACTQAMTA